MSSAWAMTLTYNEAILIPFWIRHYTSFCDRVIVYVDEDSDDGTAEIAELEGADVRPYHGNHHLDDIAFISFAQEKYKEARGKADFVIWTDADEILYHPRMPWRLSELKNSGVNIPIVTGYDMFSDSPPEGPEQITTQITRGIKSTAYSKICIFDPVLNVQWTTGKHMADISGHKIEDDGRDPLKLLHYRWLGEEWHLARNARNYARLNAENIARQHGKETYPGATGAYTPSWYKEQAKLAVECVND